MQNDVCIGDDLCGFAFNSTKNGKQIDCSSKIKEANSMRVMLSAVAG